MIHAAIPEDDRIPSYEQLHEMDKAAAAGVQVVIAPQLFPTPPELADRMVALADIRPGQKVLEPSAGTGRIIDAIRRNAHGCAITAVELNCNMAHRLRTVDCVDDTRQADFLECNGDLGTFDRIVMNPPFANADDIKHIMHALKMLKPGGRLVAICANGPRQNDKLRPIVEARGGIWEELPSDTFICTGTSVRTVLLMLDAIQTEGVVATSNRKPPLRILIWLSFTGKPGSMPLWAALRVHVFSYSLKWTLDIKLSRTG